MINLFLCCFFACFYINATTPGEFHESRLVTYARMVDINDYGYSGYSEYIGFGLVVETRDRQSNKIAFAARVLFGPPKIENASYWRKDRGMVDVQFLEGDDYFNQNRSFQNPQFPNLITDLQNGVRNRGLRGDSLRFKKFSAQFQDSTGVVKHHYNCWLEASLNQFELSTPFSFEGLYQFLDRMRNGTAGGGREFPFLYNMAGYSWYTDSVNCIGFCLRVLSRLGFVFQTNSYLSLYLNHNYSSGFSGWWGCRFGTNDSDGSSKSPRVLKAERCLERLFTSIHGVVGSNINGMKLVSIGTGPNAQQRWAGPNAMGLLSVRENPEINRLYVSYAGVAGNVVNVIVPGPGVLRN